MATAGWYPDPSGAPGQYRYWDGSDWSASTTTDPEHASPPAPTPKPRRARQARNARIGWIIALVAAIVVLVLLVWALLRGGAGPNERDPAVEDWDSSSPTVSAWDEKVTETPPPSGGSMRVCPTAGIHPATKQSGDRLTAGSVSIQKVPGWTVLTMTLPWTYDLHTQVDYVYADYWMSNVGVASLANSDGFVDVRTSAWQNFSCFKTSGYYEGYIGDQTIKDEAVTIDGHPGWRVRADVYVDLPQLPQVRGDVVDIIVIDLGPDKDHLGLFVSSYTIDDTARGKLVDDAIASLKVSN